MVAWLKVLSVSSTLLAILGAVQNFPMDISASVFGLSVAFALLAKSERKRDIIGKTTINFPTDELKKGIAIRELQ